jgi:outer membrane autotransporter protein
VDLGPGDDMLHLAGSPTINGAVVSGEGIDTLRVEDTNHHHLKQLHGTEHLNVNEGTLELHSAYTMPPDGSYQMQINGDGTCGDLLIDGKAELDGEMIVTRSRPAFHNGTTWDVLSAPTIDHSFASHTLPAPTLLLSFSVDQLPTAVQVETSVRPFNWVADNRVERAVARYMDVLLPRAQGDLANVLGDFQRLTSNSEFDEAFAALSPHSYDDYTTQAVAVARQNSRAIHRRMVDLRTKSAPYPDIPREGTGAEEDAPDVAAPPHPRESPLGLWIGSLRETADQDGNDGYVGFDSRTGGVLFGVDKMFEERSLLGASLSLASTDVDLDADRGDSDIDSTFVSLYGTWFDRNSYLETILAYGRNDTDSVRHIRVGETMGRATSDYDSDAWSASGEAGLRVALRRAIVEPFGALSYVRLHEESIREKGAGSLNMNIQSRNTDSLQSELGLRLYSRVPTTRGLFVPELTIAWSHDFDIDDRTVTTAWSGAGGTTFALDGRSLARDGLRLQADLRLITRGGLTTSLNLRSEMRHRYTSHSALLEVGLSF